MNVFELDWLYWTLLLSNFVLKVNKNFPLTPSRTFYSFKDKNQYCLPLSWICMHGHKGNRLLRLIDECWNSLVVSPLQLRMILIPPRHIQRPLQPGPAYCALSFLFPLFPFPVLQAIELKLGMCCDGAHSQSALQFASTEGLELSEVLALPSGGGGDGICQGSEIATWLFWWAFFSLSF